MRRSLIESLAGIDLGAPDRQVCVDGLGPGGARRRQLRNVEGQECGISAQFHERGFDR